MWSVGGAKKGLSLRFIIKTAYLAEDSCETNPQVTSEQASFIYFQLAGEHWKSFLKKMLNKIPILMKNDEETMKNIFRRGMEKSFWEKIGIAIEVFHSAQLELQQKLQVTE